MPTKRSQRATAAVVAGAAATMLAPSFVGPSASSKLSAVTSAPAPVAASAPASGVGAGASILGAGAAALAATAAVRPTKRCAKKDKAVRLATATEVDVDTECINAIRFLAVDAVNKANSGHPGAPMGQAPIGYLLFAEEMQYNPEDPKWVNRDRFVLSSGHGCMLQYSLLHLAGYDSVSIDDIKQFRQWGSKTPGHPENFETDGIEVTTGPLGMGISNAVGLAAAEAHLAAVYNKPGMELIDHYTYTIAGDGCMQEGISHEACAYAGHLGLGKLIAFYDDNGITIDGHTDLSFTEDVGKRFEAYGWQVLEVPEGNTDVDAIRKAIKEAKACTDKPTLIKVKTTIGFGSPNKADSHDAHGAPLGADEAEATRKQLGWNYGEFEVPDQVYDTFRKHAKAGSEKQAAWNKMWKEYQEKEPELAAQFKRAVMDRKLPDNWTDALPKVTPEDKGKATRLHSQDCLNAIANVLPEFMGGSADLAPSNMTLMKCTGDFLKDSYSERNMRFGIREFGMGAVSNALSLDKTGIIPYCATFTIFTDYMRGAIRIAALSQAGTIFVTTHDSIAVGEDGPTHQPIETIPSLRLIPDLTVMRPADGNETAGAYKYAVERSKNESRPTMMAFSRQAVDNLPNSSIENTLKGAYEVIECEKPELILIGTGSEVGLCVDAAKKLDKKVRVVSMPSCEVYREQPDSYKSKLLPADVPKMSVEAACTAGWGEFADAFVGIDVFGASAPGGTCLDKFGFNVDNVVSCAERLLEHLACTKKLSAVTSAPAPVAASAPASGVGAGASILGAGAAALAATAAVRPNKRCAKKDNVVRLATATEVDVDTECINAIRFLAVDAVNKANSGHPGAPMGQAPIGYLLFAEEMQYNPEDPKWVNRDRFVLSSGHGCMLQYSLLHLAGYDSVSIDDIKQFRQTTGPLGMGISNAVGLAAAEAHLAAVYNKPGMELIDHYTYTIAGDGCMQEGISHEACAYAGHLGLGKLIAFYDDNGITIDGHTDLSFTEDVGKRFEAYGWQVLEVSEGNTDVDAIRKAIKEAKACTDKPTLIKVKTTIGFGSPNKADSHDAHGAPLGADEAEATRKQLGWNYGEFEVPEQVYDTFRKHAKAGSEKQAAWNKMWKEYQEKEPELAAQFKRAVMDRKLPDNWTDALPKVTPEDKGKATRLHSQDCLNAIANVLPEFMGGSADLAPSNMTLMKCTGDFLKDSYSERNMRFGIREFGMGAVSNALSLDKTGIIPYCATFTIFTDYMRGAIRIAALSQAGSIFVTTHDSIAVGEDGPTHQPIETLPSLRLIPDLTVMRPADGNETAGAYKYAVERSKNESRPTMMAFSRQAVDNLPNSSIENTMKGAYEVIECEKPELILIGTGSEVGLCVDAAKKLDGQVRVVSMPSCEVFRAQPDSYKSKLLPADVPKMSVEAACTSGWGEFADAFVGIDVFGASAPGGTCLDKFGFNVDNVTSCAERCLKGERGVLSNGSQGKH
ncbi:unnamed protein product [Durusdinium trenchii]|uniref:transketolase n=1 Tax=Durusdinium trenchii TaxID=1381693 RepID=A0ABP0JHF5_9DINO